MRFAIFTVSLPEYTPEEAVVALRAAGYEGIEWRVTDQAASDTPGFWAGNRCTWPLSSFVQDAPRIRALAEHAGLLVPNVGSYVTCDDPRAVEQAMQGTALLGAPQLRVNLPHYNPQNTYLAQRERSRAQYREVAAMAQQYGVRALIEMHHATLTPSASAAATFLDGFDPRYVGVIHDAGNMVHEGYEQYRLGLEVLGPYLGHVHLKNVRWQHVGTRADVSAEWQASWAAITGGVVDFAALLRALRAVGYDNWLSFEDFSTDLPLIERVQGNLRYIQQVLSQVIAEDA